MDYDRKMIFRAIKIAKEGIRQGNGPFGAIITKNGTIVAEAVNRVTLDHDPTAHAEILAIRQAAKELRSHNLENCTLYCSCEPCPMCFGAIYWAGITRVVYASGRHDAARAGFGDENIYDQISLAPENRTLAFEQITGLNEQEVFETWERNSNKIPY